MKVIVVQWVDGEEIFGVYRIRAGETAAQAFDRVLTDAAESSVRREGLPGDTVEGSKASYNDALQYQESTLSE